MPVRRSTVHALELVGYDGRRRHSRPARQLGDVRPRDRRRARRALPDAPPHRGRPVPRRGRRPSGSSRSTTRCPRWHEGRSHARRARARPRRSRSARSTASTSGTGACSRPRSTPGSRRRSSPSTRTRASCSATASSCSRRSSGGSSCSRELGVDDLLVVDVHLELARSSPRSSPSAYLRPIGAEVVVAGEDFRFGRGRAGDLDLLEALGFDVAPGAARRGRLVEPDPPAARDGRGRRRGAAARPAARGRGDRRRRRRARRHARLPDREPRRRAASCSSPRTGSTPAQAGEHRAASRSASTRTTAATSGGSRRSCSTSRATSTGSGSSSSSGSGSATSASFDSEAGLIDQIARDVEARPSARLPRLADRRPADRKFGAWRIFPSMGAQRGRPRVAVGARASPVPRLRRVSSSRPTAAPLARIRAARVRLRGVAAGHVAVSQAARAAAPSRIACGAGPRDEADAAEVVDAARPVARREARRASASATRSESPARR